MTFTIFARGWVHRGEHATIYIAPRVIVVNGKDAVCECRDNIVHENCVEANYRLWLKKQATAGGFTSGETKVSLPAGRRKS
jgi:hypothetical protein